jgi:hypothetical protein
MQDLAHQYYYVGVPLFYLTETYRTAAHWKIGVSFVTEGGLAKQLVLADGHKFQALENYRPSLPFASMEDAQAEIDAELEREAQYAATFDGRLEALALSHFGDRIETLQSRGRDSLDWHEVCVRQIQSAVEAAYQMGVDDATAKSKPTAKAKRSGAKAGSK